MEEGCHEVKDIRDDDSLIERCWEEKYRGDSRKWLIRDGSYRKPRGSLCTTMKATYTVPLKEQDKKEYWGARRAMLVQKFHDEATAELNREITEPPPVEEYCTEYDGNYNFPGFQVDNEFYTKNTELYEKYPLYLSLPTTFQSFNLKQVPPAVPSGCTTLDSRQPFKRNSSFSKPLDEV